MARSYSPNVPDRCQGADLSASTTGHLAILVGLSKPEVDLRPIR